MFLQLALLGQKETLGTFWYPIVSKLEDTLAFGHLIVHKHRTL